MQLLFSQKKLIVDISFAFFRKKSFKNPNEKNCKVFLFKDNAQFDHILRLSERANFFFMAHGWMQAWTVDICDAKWYVHNIKNYSSDVKSLLCCRNNIDGLKKS